MAIPPESPVNLIVDGSLAAGAVIVPMWIYQASVIMGMITALLGMILVLVRCMIAIRTWRRG